MDSNAGPRRFGPDFLRLWGGQLVSQVGSQAFAVATAFWIKHATGSPALVGTMMMLGTLPLVLLSPLGGVVADLAPRRRILVLCDFVSGLAVLFLAAVMFLRPEATRAIVITLGAASLVVGAARAFFSPALRAAIPGLVHPDRLAASNSLHEATTEGAALFGQAAGGFAYRVLGAPLLLVIDGASYLAAAVFTACSRIPSPESRGAPRGWREGMAAVRAELGAGIAFVRRQPGLGALVALAAAVNALGAPVFVMLPFYAEDSLGAGAGLYGLMIAAFGGGGIAGYGLAARAGGQAGASARVLLSTLVVLAACLALLAFAPGPAAALGLLAVAGACNGYFGVRAVSIIQARTPDGMRGRVFGLLQTLAMGLAPVAMLATGLVAGAAGLDARTVFLACGMALVAVTVAAWGRPSLRGYLGGPSAS